MQRFNINRIEQNRIYINRKVKIIRICQEILKHVTSRTCVLQLSRLRAYRPGIMAVNGVYVLMVGLFLWGSLQVFDHLADRIPFYQGQVMLPFFQGPLKQDSHLLARHIVLSIPMFHAYCENATLGVRFQYELLVPEPPDDCASFHLYGSSIALCCAWYLPQPLRYPYYWYVLWPLTPVVHQWVVVLLVNNYSLTQCNDYLLLKSY